MHEGFPTEDDLVAYVQGRLPADETDWIDARAADDAGLREAVERTRTVVAILAEATQEATVRRVNSYLEQGFRSRASDLHLDLNHDGGVVRLRIDGVLHEIDRLPLDTARAAVARLKELLAMPVTDSRRPADGRLLCEMDGKRLDLRGSYLPGINGGRLCLRYLDRSGVSLGLDQVHLLPEELAAIRRMIRQPYGIIVTSGPTGSGKTTLMYSMIRELAGESLNVLSIEDPVELDLPWVAQTAISPAAGVTFATALRAVMRQDPDVIMVGEIRDRESLDGCVQAALTGHLVLTQLHADTGVGAIRRLLDMGVEPFLLRSSLIGVTAQRLARRVCDQCGREVECRFPAAAVRLGIEPEGLVYRAGEGCEHCRHTGFRGRTGLYEVVEVTPALADAIGDGAEDHILRELAFSGDLPDLRGHAARKVADGVTSVEEAARVLSLT